MRDLATKRDDLLSLVGSLESFAVAFSAGVDSTVVAKAAQLALGPRAVAVTADSPSLAEGELDQARALAGQIGIRHHVIRTDEFENPEYVRNAPDRCFHCKSELYQRLVELAPQLDFQVIVNGANVDDQSDYRPGMQAALDFSVRSPLIECGLGKQDVRDLARAWQLPVWNKPARPCLSSRVAYGQSVTPERLAMVDAAERFLRERGFGDARVRYHEGDLARVEVPSHEILQLCEPVFREEFARLLRQLGFRFATIDLEGFRSGSLNVVIPAVELTRVRKPS